MRNVYQLKDTGYYIGENFGKATLNIRTELWDEVKRLRREGYYVVNKYDRTVTNKGMKWRGNKCISIYTILICTSKKVYIKT